MTRSGNRRPATDAEKATARTMFEAGDSLGKIGKEVGYTSTTVSSWSKRLGWSRPEGFELTPAAKKTAAAAARNAVLWESSKIERANRALEAEEEAISLLLKAMKAEDPKASRQWVMVWAIAADKSRQYAADAKAESATNPRMTDPVELARGLADLVARARPS